MLFYKGQRVGLVTVEFAPHLALILPASAAFPPATGHVLPFDFTLVFDWGRLDAYWCLVVGSERLIYSDPDSDLVRFQVRCLRADEIEAQLQVAENYAAENRALLAETLAALKDQGVDRTGQNTEPAAQPA